MSTTALVHTLSASVLHGVNEGNNGTNRSNLASCLGKLNPALFARPHPLAALNAAKATVGDPTVLPIDVVMVRASTCRESLFAEYEAIREQRALEEMEARASGGGLGSGSGDDSSPPSTDIVELATTMKQRAKARNPFSRHVDSRLRRFACTPFNGCVLAPEVPLASGGGSAPAAPSVGVEGGAPTNNHNNSGKKKGAKKAARQLPRYATTVRNKKRVYYRSPWSGLHQTVIDVPAMSRALHDEAEPEGEADAAAMQQHGQHNNNNNNSSSTGTPTDSLLFGGGGDGAFGGADGNANGGGGALATVCPIVAQYHSEAMGLFGNKQMTHHRHIAEAGSTPARVAAAREVEAQLNTLLNSYADAYYCSAVEIPTAVNTTSAGGAARLGPAPRNAYGESIKTHAKPSDHDVMASAYARDFGFERAGQPRQHCLEVNTIIRNRVKVDPEEEWEGEFDDDDDAGSSDDNSDSEEAGREATKKNGDEEAGVASAALGGRLVIPPLRRLRSSTERVMRLGLGSAVPLSLELTMHSDEVNNTHKNEAENRQRSAAKKRQPKPPHRAWTTVHTAIVQQKNQEVKVAMASRVLLRQTTRAPIATVLHHGDDTAVVGPEAEHHQQQAGLFSPRPLGGADDEEGLDVDPIALYGFGDGSLSGNAVATATAAGFFTTLGGGGAAVLGYGAALATARGDAPRGGGGARGASAAAPYNPYPNLVIETDAALSHAHTATMVFPVGKGDDVLASRPAAVAQMVGDAVQATENEGIVPLMLDVISGNVAAMVRSILPSSASSAGAAGTTSASTSEGKGGKDVVIEAMGAAGGASHNYAEGASAAAAALLGGEFSRLEVAEDRPIALRLPIATADAGATQMRQAAAAETARLCAAAREARRAV